MRAQPGPRILFVQLGLFPDRILPPAFCIASPFAHCVLNTRPGIRCLPHMPFHLILTQQPYKKIDFNIIPILQLRKYRIREVKEHSQSHKFVKWQDQDTNPSLVMYMWGILRIKHGVLISALGGGVEVVPFTSIGKAKETWKEWVWFWMSWVWVPGAAVFWLTSCVDYSLGKRQGWRLGNQWQTDRG